MPAHFLADYAISRIQAKPKHRTLKMEGIWAGAHAFEDPAGRILEIKY